MIKQLRNAITNDSSYHQSSLQQANGSYQQSSLARVNTSESETTTVSDSLLQNEPLISEQINARYDHFLKSKEKIM